MKRQFCFFRTIKYYFSTKLEYPREESGTERNFGGKEIVGIVHKSCSGLIIEVVQDGVHGVSVAEELHRCAFAIEELEGFLAEIRDTVSFWALY